MSLPHRQTWPLKAWAVLEDPAADQEREEEDQEHDEEVDAKQDSQTRDYAEARKFARLLKAGHIPGDVLKLHNDAAKGKGNTQVNSLFQRSASWKMLAEV